MATVTVTKNGYTVDSLYQWDSGQILEVYGLSVPGTPELHFSLKSLADAIVQPTTIDAAGVIRAQIPNELLEKGSPINAYVCTKEGGSFRSLRTIVIPIEKRPQPCTELSEEEIVNG